MAISTSKTEIFSPSLTDIKWSSFQSTLGGQPATNVRFGVYKRDLTSDSPIVPDADENVGITSDNNLNVSSFRGAISEHNVTFGSAEYQNVEFQNYFGNNLVKNVVKNITIDGTIYSNDTNTPAAELDVGTVDSIRNLDIDISTTGAIYGAGADAAPADSSQGVTGGTALYVQSGTNTRNFTINLESSGGSFGKLYGGGGGGVTGSPGSSQTRSSCNRNQDNSYNYPYSCPYFQPGNPGNFNPSGTTPYLTQYTYGIEASRNWNNRAESRCRSTYRGNSFGGVTLGGAVHDYIPGRGSPNYIQGAWGYRCNIRGYQNPPNPGSTVPQTCYGTTVATRGDSGTITAPGGPGGSGGKGQGYQRAFAAGTAGTSGNTVICSSLGSLYSGPSATGGNGLDGTSGGNWGDPGTSSNVATGGLAGYALQKSSGSIDITVVGQDSDRFKGRSN